MPAAFAVGEALLLGLASGPACVASCGPVIIPSILAERSGWRSHARYLSSFLAGRLIGYVCFAALAWQIGMLVALSGTMRVYGFAVVHLLIAGALLRFAYVAGRPCAATAQTTQLVTIGASCYRPAPYVLGTLTGISLCPPFVAAGVRAAEASSMAAAVLFFAVFFIGTAVWFVPFAALGWIRRNEAVTTVARMTMVLIALYYLFAGAAALVRRSAYGV